MDILSYLLELLQQSKEVGITGLGTFYKKKFPGRYDKEKQSFLPPAYALQFTNEVKGENALATFISSKRNISVESAQYYIDQFVEETNKKLELEHEANLENLGRLFYTEHDGLSFEAEKNINYGSEFFGLPSLAETDTEASKPTDLPFKALTEDEVYEEIDEAPVVKELPNKDKTEQILPQIENVELDEVNDDLKNTLKHSETPVEHEIEVPESVKEQHEEHPDRFGHKPESEEVHVPAPSDEIIENSVEETPAAVEVSKTYINLHDDLQKEEEVVHEAPEFIKEQHAEHPNRFGHDPIDPEYAEKRMATWVKILIAIVILVVIAAVTYYVKPELFGQNKAVETKTIAPVDSNKVAVDSAKFKQDSIAKTDSILKANQVNAAKTVKTDTVKKIKTPVSAPAPIPNAGMVTFEVIGTSVKTKKRAEQFVQSMKKYGIDAKIIDAIPGKLIKVSLASFKTEAEANAQKQILAEKTKIVGLYTQQINHTQ